MADRSCRSGGRVAGALDIPGCQLDCIWNELQSRIGGLTCDPGLKKM